MRIAVDLGLAYTRGLWYALGRISKEAGFEWADADSMVRSSPYRDSTGQNAGICIGFAGHDLSFHHLDRSSPPFPCRAIHQYATNSSAELLRLPSSTVIVLLLVSCPGHTDPLILLLSLRHLSFESPTSISSSSPQREIR